jgi:hypothetical protein
MDQSRATYFFPAYREVRAAAVQLPLESCHFAP